MKASRKALLITATALVAVGAALMLGAFALAGGDMENLSTDQREWACRTYEVTADDAAALAAVSCSDDAESVYIEGYEGDVVRVEYWEHQRRTVDIQQDGGTLLVSGNAHDESLEFGVFAGTSEDHSTRVLVPREFAGNLSASSTAGYAAVAGIVGAKEIAVYSENGFAIADSLQAQTLRVESRNGAVQCSAVDVAGDLAASSENGVVHFTDVLAGSMSAESENGAVSVSESFAQSTLFATSRNGDITVYCIDAPEIEVSAGNGMARITLPGSIDDYAIDVSAEGGCVNAPASSNRDASRKVTARTQNGELFIECEDGDLETLVEHGRWFPKGENGAESAFS